MTETELQERVSHYPWFHSIDLGQGVVTPGGKTPEILDPESAAVFGRIEVAGRSVLDIGAWNGYYTVEAKRRGATEVLALDEFTWLDPNYRGKESFDFVMSHLGMRVQTRVLDVHRISVEEVGRWDVTLFLGVFYHLIDPIVVLQRLAEITREVLVVETALDGHDIERPAMFFYPGTELADDPTNWWAPNRACMEALLRTVGFTRVSYMPNPAPGHDKRGIFHAYKR
jgi:tRNA (mo5U34)-methyltransferase